MSLLEVPVARRPLEAIAFAFRAENEALIEESITPELYRAPAESNFIRKSVF